jgi:hypothetical protein
MIDQEVASRVAAYKGNPQALQQKYATSQQLIDLLALQKIKSAQEAAAREMQMQLAQQQAANGESNMTVAQQREKEVMDMTKQELAQQRGDLAQQQDIEQKQAMQQLMGGIASAPGAGSAMEPKAMAAGGIVAFSTGDGVKDERYKRKEGESFEDYRARVLALDQADTQARLKQERDVNERARLTELESRGGSAIPANPFGIKRDLGIASLAPAKAPAPPIATADAETQKLARLSANPPAAQNMNPALRPVASMAPPPPQAGPQPPAPPKPQQQQGLGGLQMGPPEDTLGNALTRESIAAMKIDPRARQLEEEKRIEDRLKLTPAQRGVYEEGIAGLKGMYEKDFDPEMQRREGIKRYLLGMGGRSIGEFAGGAGAAMDYDTAQRNQQRARFGELQGKREGLIGLDRAAVSGGIEGGYKAYEQGEKTKQVGLTSGANVYGTEAQVKDNAAMREIERLKISAQNAATAAARESNDISRVQSLLGSMLRDRVRAEEVADRPFLKQLALIDMTLQANPKDANALKQKQAIELQREAARDAATKEIDMLRAQVEARLTGGVRPIAGAKVEKLSK